MNRRPPKIAEFLLKTAAHRGNRDTLLGDFEEEYRALADEKGALFAGLWYYTQVFLPLVYFIGSYILWSTVMLRSYFKSTYRTLLKNRMYGVISILSLSVAIGCALAIFVILDTAFHFEAFHENADSIYQVKTIVKRNDQSELWGNTPVPLGPALQNEFPSIRRVVRVERGRGIVRRGDAIFSEPVHFVDAGFLQMFSFPSVRGEKDALSERNAVVITEDIVKKYFGDADPFGESLSIKLGDGTNAEFVVRGVLEKLPVNSSIRFRILIPYDHWLNLDRENNGKWSSRTLATLIQVDNPADLAAIKAGLPRYVKVQNEADFEWQALEFTFDPLRNLVNSNSGTINSFAYGFGMAGVIVFLLIGVLLLLLAVFNYVNIAIVSYTKRLKEIAVRKVLGSGRGGIMRQFIGENVILCTLALVAGAFIAQFVILPVMAVYAGTTDYDSIFVGPDVWLIFLMIVIFTGVFGGAYPAFYISAFKPVQIIRGKLRFSGSHPFTKMLLIVQFVFNFMLISLCVVVRMNAEYQKTIDWGYDQRHLVAIPLYSESHYAPLRDEMLKSPAVIQTAGARNHIARSFTRDYFEFEGKEYDSFRFEAGAGYIETMKLRLQSGRLFDAARQTDVTRSVVVNEEFVRSMEWDDPLSKQIKIDNDYYNVIGVVEDFHYDDFMAPIEPVLFRLVDESSFNYLVIRTEPGRETEVAAMAMETWKRMIPDEPYNGLLQDEVFDYFFRGEEEISTLFGFFAAIALIISSMGLFGLVSINIAKRTKEIGIRKALGADLTGLFRLLNKPVMILMAFSIVIGSILSYFAINAVMEVQHEYHILMSPSHIVFISFVILLTAFLTVSYQVYRAARANPVDSLRYE